MQTPRRATEPKTCVLASSTRTDRAEQHADAMSEPCPSLSLDGTVASQSLLGENSSRTKRWDNRYRAPSCCMNDSMSKSWRLRLTQSTIEVHHPTRPRGLLLTRVGNRATRPRQWARLCALPGYFTHDGVSTRHGALNCSRHVWHPFPPSLQCGNDFSVTYQTPRGSHLVALRVFRENRLAAFPIRCVECINHTTGRANQILSCHCVLPSPLSGEYQQAEPSTPTQCESHRLLGLECGTAPSYGPGRLGQEEMRCFRHQVLVRRA